MIYDGEAVTLTFDDFGTCLGDGGVTLASSPGGSPAAPAVPVGAQPTFTG